MKKLLLILILISSCKENIVAVKNVGEWNVPANTESYLPLAVGNEYTYEINQGLSYVQTTHYSASVYRETNNQGLFFVPVGVRRYVEKKNQLNFYEEALTGDHEFLFNFNHFLENNDSINLKYSTFYSLGEVYVKNDLLDFGICKKFAEKSHLQKDYYTYTVFYYKKGIGCVKKVIEDLTNNKVYYRTSIELTQYRVTDE